MPMYQPSSARHKCHGGVQGRRQEFVSEGDKTGWESGERKTLSGVQGRVPMGAPEAEDITCMLITIAIMC